MIILHKGDNEFHMSASCFRVSGMSVFMRLLRKTNTIIPSIPRISAIKIEIKVLNIFEWSITPSEEIPAPNLAVTYDP